MFTSRQELYAMEGITFLPGIDDNPSKTEVTQLSGARRILSFARDHSLGLLSIWAIQRDNGGCPGSIDSNSCSGISQSSWAFRVPVRGRRVVLIGFGVGAVQREAGHVPVQLADVDAEGADRADRDRPGDLLQVRGNRVEGTAQLVVVQRERGDAEDLRDRPVAAPVLDVDQRRG